MSRDTKGGTQDQDLPGSARDAGGGDQATVQMQVTLLGVAAPPRPAAAGQGEQAPGTPRFVSMKPPSEPGHRRSTRPIAAIERPEMRPRLRPMTAGKRSHSVPPGALGRYAPTRAATEREPRTRIWPYVLLTIAAAAAGAGVAFWALSS